MLARKYYIAIAQILCETKAKTQTVHGLADYFKQDNARFDRGRFIKAVNACKRKK